jgi:hypothetical protein
MVTKLLANGERIDCQTSNQRLPNRSLNFRPKMFVLIAKLPLIITVNVKFDFTLQTLDPSIPVILSVILSSYCQSPFFTSQTSTIFANLSSTTLCPPHLLPSNTSTELQPSSQPNHFANEIQIAPSTRVFANSKLPRVSSALICSLITQSTFSQC